MNNAGREWLKSLPSRALMEAVRRGSHIEIFMVANGV
jgi:hypothetical protein